MTRRFNYSMMYRMQRKTTKLRELFGSKPILRIVGAHDGLGAKLIERNGFDGVWASGLEISASHGVPDANILSMTEHLTAASVMNDATLLPILCDCDTGYGNAANVMHMIKKYEAAGMAGVVIEDKCFPKTNSFIPGRQELSPMEEFMGKIEAAKNAQKDSDFMVFARVEALIAGWGMEEALRRAYAYAEAGADGIVIHSKATSPEEIFSFSKQWTSRLPLVAIPTTYYQVTAENLAKNRFQMVIYANQGIRASIRAMDETLASIARSGSTALVEEKIAPLKEVFEIQDMFKLKEVEKRFEKKETIQVVIPAAGEHTLDGAIGKTLKNLPLCMLEIGGKTLIDRQLDTLRSCGVNDICIVGGFEREKLKADGAHILYNPDYGKTSNAYSFMFAREQFKNKLLMVYSDIVFDRKIVEQLLESPHPVTLVIDRAYQTMPFRDKRLDLVIAEDSHEKVNGRVLTTNPFKNVKKVSREILKKEATHEFIGIALFQGEGVSKLVHLWEEGLALYKRKKFYSASDIYQADFTDLVQYLIDQGLEVHGMEIEHGWSEIHSAEDLGRIRGFFDEHSKVSRSL